MRQYFSVFSARGRFSLSKRIAAARKRFAQQYLTASEESSMGVLTKIVRPESYAQSKERHIDCRFTPQIGKQAAESA